MANKIQTNKKRFFYPDEYQRMIFKCNQNQKFMATCLINTGARINEVRGIKPQNLSDERKSVVLEQTKVRAKRGEKIPSPRIIAVSNAFFKYLKENLGKRRFLTTNAFNLAIKAACKEASIPRPEEYSAHKFRKWSIEK